MRRWWWALGLVGCGDPTSATTTPVVGTDPDTDAVDAHSGGAVHSGVLHSGEDHTGTDPDPTGDTAAADTGGPTDTGLPGDTDLDTVPDGADLCPGLDDRVDLDQDLVPDCAENLLTNGQFATVLAPWRPSTVGSNTSTAAWDATDASGWGSSGSARVLNTSPMPDANAAGVTSGCVTAIPGQAYDVYFRYYLSSATLAGTGPQLVTSFMTYTDAACQVPAASATPGPPLTVVDRWATVALPGTVTMWPTWRSFEIQIALFKPGSSAPMPFGLDDVLVQETP